MTMKIFVLIWKNSYNLTIFSWFKFQHKFGFLFCIGTLLTSSAIYFFHSKELLRLFNFKHRAKCALFRMEALRLIKLLLFSIPVRIFFNFRCRKWRWMISLFLIGTENNICSSNGRDPVTVRCDRDFKSITWNDSHLDRRSHPMYWICWWKEVCWWRIFCMLAKVYIDEVRMLVKTLISPTYSTTTRLNIYVRQHTFFTNILHQH